MSHTEIARFLPLPPTLRTALVLSVAVHVALVAWLRPDRIELPRPFAVEHLEVSFAASPALRAISHIPKNPAPSNAAARRPAAPEAAARAPAESTAGTDRDEPLVEAKFDVTTLHNPKPPYPLTARRKGIEGRVLLAAHVRADGTCAEVHLKHSSGHGLLDQSALDTVRRWRFLPARRGRASVDSWVEIPISFRLER